MSKLEGGRVRKISEISNAQLEKAGMLQWRGEGG